MLSSIREFGFFRALLSAYCSRPLCRSASFEAHACGRRGMTQMDMLDIFKMDISDLTQQFYSINPADQNAKALVLHNPSLDKLSTKFTVP